MPSSRPRRFPDLENWVLLVISIVFFCGGLLVLKNDWRSMLFPVVFFGLCALAFISMIRRKKRERRWVGASVRVVGGANIYVKGGRLGIIASGAIVVGALTCFVDPTMPWVLWVMGAFIGLVGVVIAIAIPFASRRQFMRFDPDGLTFASYRFRYRIDWDNVADIIAIECGNNPFVGVDLVSTQQVIVEPASKAAAFQRLLRQNQNWMGVDLFIAPRNFGIDGFVLAEAIRRYASDPAARAELARRRLSAQ